MADTVIRIAGLSKSYGTLKAVDRLDFEVVRSECFGLLGPNGAGKTTTMKIIYGKAEVDYHQETVLDVFGYHPYKDALTIKTFSGIVPQQDNLDVELNVQDNLAIYARFYGIPSREAKRRISDLLEFMELKDKAAVKIRELSGGMKRRLTIARALLNQPRLLILDEPTTGLDPQVRHLIWSKLRELKDQGVTVLLTTHYMEEAYQICDRIIIMDQGKKILEGNPRELLSSNLETYVIEVYGQRPEEMARLTAERESGIRYEIFQDVLFIYSNDSEKLNQYAKGMRLVDYHIRQSNLEDLFLKTTGRSLNELQ